MKRGSIFETDGIPRMSEALPLAMQHVVAMIVGCVTPAIIVSGAVPGGLSREDQVILIQSALVIAALSTLLQLFPIGGKAKFAIGSGLPIIMGVSPCDSGCNTSPDNVQFYMHDPRSVLCLPHRENRLFRNIFPL